MAGWDFGLELLVSLVQAYIFILDLFMNYRVLQDTELKNHSFNLVKVFTSVFRFPSLCVAIAAIVFSFRILAKITHAPSSQDPLPSIEETMEPRKVMTRNLQYS